MFESSYTSAEQYALCKEVGMHPGIMCLVTIKHMAGVLKKQGYVWEEEETKRLCAEAKEHALVAYGKESSIMPYLERIEEAKQGRLTVTQVQIWYENLLINKAAWTSLPVQILKDTC